MTGTLLNDIFSYNRKQLGKKGDKLTILSVHGECLIVNNEKCSFTIYEHEIKRDEKERAD